MELWIEKYRPRKLDNVIMSDEYRKRFKEFIATGEIPHLLLHGAVGSGKTSIAKILLQELDATILEMNASDERGLDVIRNKIKSFVSSQSFNKWKVVFLDEADALTADAQFALRNMMETFSKKSRFILTANYVEKIIEPIQSRCTMFEFSALPKKDIVHIAKHIMEEESIVVQDIESLVVLVEDSYPDVRKVINMAQYSSVDGIFIYESHIGLYAEIMGLLKVKDLKQIRERLSKSLNYTGLYRFLFDNAIELGAKDKTGQVLLTIAEYMYRDSTVADREINFAACCLNIMSYI